MNRRKSGLDSKNLQMRAVSANTPKKQNAVRQQKTDSTQQATNYVCKSSLVQSQWSAILRQHIEMLDSHIKFLDQSVRRVNCEKPIKLSDPEAEESISRRVIFRVMNAAMEVLTRSREAAVGILPAYEPLDDKDLDRKGNVSHRLETVSRWDKDIASRATDTISELDSSNIGSNGADNETDSRKMRTPPNIAMNKLCLSTKSKKPKNKTAHNTRVGEEQRDNKRTKSDVDRFENTPSKFQIREAEEVNYTGSNKKKKKRIQLVEPGKSCELKKATGSQKENTATLSMTGSTDLDIDFAAIEIKLQEEIAAGERAAKEAQRPTTYTTSSSPTSLNSRKKKRRRCSSDDLSRVRQVEKKLRMEKLEKIPRDKKRKVDEIEVDKEVNNYRRKKIRRIPKGKAIQND